MNQYCVVLCGLRAGVSDVAATWSPVATALKLDPDEFAQRVIATLPMIVRRNLDQSAAERIAELLLAMHVDARALPDDEQLVYIRHAETTCGPLPHSALADFIRPGDAYRIRGNSTWLPWPTPTIEADDSMADGVPTVDADELTAAAAAPGFTDESTDDAAPWPTASDHSERIDTPTEESLASSVVTNDGEPHQVLPPALPDMPASPQPSQPPISVAEPEPDAAVAEVDAPIAGNALIDPTDEAPNEGDSEDAIEPPTNEAAETAPNPRSGATRLIVLLLVAGAAYWAYSHWYADTRAEKTPVATSQSTKLGNNRQPTAPVPTASTSATHPVAAATTASTTSAATLPAAATSAPAPTSTSAAPIKAPSAILAPAASVPAPTSPAPASSTATVPATGSSAARR